MNKQQFAFARINFILLAIGMALVVLGLILMAGDGSTEKEFNPAIFAPIHIKVAPLTCLFGYLFIIVAILFPRRASQTDKPTADDRSTEA